MAPNDPFDRNWVETKILLTLNDSKVPLMFKEMRDTLIPDMGVTIVCTVETMRKEGLVRVFKPSPRNEKYVEITAEGRAVIFHIMTVGKLP
ncbi:MAG: hypothetical protein JRE57_00065 [Deltaproteobacteria bacterium]|nr:hypothetical protein [Deltaproteobacteria bacterium]